VKINRGLYRLPFFPSNDWSNIETAFRFDLEDCASYIFSNVGRYELLVETEGCIGLGLMLGRKEIVCSDEYIGEYTGIVKVYDESDTSNYNATLVEGQYIIDAKDFCNILKYCNHSCKPNAYLKVCRHSPSGELRVGMFSKCSIKPFSWINICYCKGKTLKEFFKLNKCFCNSCVKTK
jgi:SET domain